MCGIAVATGAQATGAVAQMLPRLHHRGPDAHGTWSDREVALGHTRLSIIDLSESGRQPMVSADGRFALVFNGEVYNHVELRGSLDDYPFRSRTDSEVVLAAWARWGPACLERLIGMFAFAIWDARDHRLTAVRDRFGVKPLYHADLPDGGLALASEIKALHAAGVPAVQDDRAWATYLARGLYDHSAGTFWRGISAVPAGCMLEWQGGAPTVKRWYDLATRASEIDRRDERVVRDEYLSLLEDSVRLRFRADVPVGVNLSGGVDSSTLLGVIHRIQGADSSVKVYTFVTGDPDYDELPWVEDMLARTKHPLVTCSLRAEDVPALAEHITAAADEPFGGIPTLAYARIFARARQDGILVLLDGQGMDEQWAGYDYYRSTSNSVVQGTSSALRSDCLARDFEALAGNADAPAPFPDRLRNLQLRDATVTKIPRALRFNDRISMAASTELREPFLDHRLFELAMRQPPERKIQGDVGKYLLRELTVQLVPKQLRAAAKRPVQTPQREWLRGPLREWADAHIEAALAAHAAWFDVPAARRAWHEFAEGAGDNSFWVWQWISASLMWRCQ